MSIGSSLSIAVSGLTAAARSARVVSDNVANAMTEGYARREIQLSSRVVDGTGAGVKVDGVRRIVDQALLADRRLADADVAYRDGQSAFLEAVSGLVGRPDDDGSLAGRLRRFDAALVEAASRPDSDTRLANVLTAAEDLTQGIKSAADGIQSERMDAERAIASEVDALNSALGQLEALNGEIIRLNGTGRDTSGLEDARQQVVDDIARIVPVREIARQDGAIALYTAGGAVLIDGPASTFAFAPVNFITPDMTAEAGSLSSLTRDGQPVATTGPYAAMGGGALGALFEVRDTLATKAQARLDAFARDLMERFEAPTVDATVAAGDPGLFTDGGAAFDPLNPTGLANRLDVNALVDPDRGGELRRFRDGLGSAAAGPVGNAAQLQAFVDALGEARVPATADISTAERTAFTLAGDLSSRVAGDVANAERQQSFAAAQQTVLADLERAGGVDTDQEMQKLLLIEQAYAANARVIQTIQALLDRLLEI